MDADFTLIEEDQKPYVTFAEKHGVDAEEAKKKWDEAEKKASEELGVAVDKFSGKEYGYTMAIFKKMLGIKESFTVGKRLILEGVVLREGSRVEVLEESLKDYKDHDHQYSPQEMKDAKIWWRSLSMRQQDDFMQKGVDAHIVTAKDSRHPSSVTGLWVFLDCPEPNKDKNGNIIT